jgi:hypothetical protein
MPMDHEHHHHGAGPNATLIAATHECMGAADVCLQHCIERLGNGDKTMADCARSVEQMRAMVGALAQVAAVPNLRSTS